MSSVSYVGLVRKPLSALVPVSLVLATLVVITASWAARYVGTASLLRGWDAQFYYAAARSLAVSGDLDVTDDLALSPGVGDFDADGDGHLEVPARNAQGQVTNMYPIGLSLLEAPWIAVASAVRRLLTGGDADRSGEMAYGYSKPEVLLVAIGVVGFTIFGLLVLARVASEYTPLPWAVAAVLATVVCSPLLYYITVTPFMSHGAALATVILILRLLQRFERRSAATVGELCGLAALAGLLFLIRPQQILLIPIAAPILLPLLFRQQRRSLALVLPGSVFALAVGLMLYANYSQFGRFTINAYSSAGAEFRWLEPSAYTVLLSADRGLLWMTPIVIVSLFGFLMPHARRHAVPWIVLVHGMVQLYLIMAWSYPEQGDSFGARMWIESLPVVTLGLSFLFVPDSRSRRAAIVAVAALCAAWNGGLILAKRDLTASHSEVVRSVLRRLHLADASSSSDAPSGRNPLSSSASKSTPTAV